MTTASSAALLNVEDIANTAAAIVVTPASPKMSGRLVACRNPVFSGLRHGIPPSMILRHRQGKPLPIAAICGLAL
ncbi:hypothetical protein LP421_28725 [Rhizobium sp. RCAM05350]|nr:hypothetical protein LP421_28725 [Rhizobium sp. RCAM05350]